MEVEPLSEKQMNPYAFEGTLTRYRIEITCTPFKANMLKMIMKRWGIKYQGLKWEEEENELIEKQ